MSKTVTIPSDVSRMEITINDKTYTYAGGATVTVPDEVAALLSDNEKHVGVRPVGEPKNEGIYDGSDYIPVYTDSDGDLRILKQDVRNVADGEIPDTAPFCVTFTMESTTVKCDKTAAQIKAAISAGKLVYGIYAGEVLNMISYTISTNSLSAVSFQGSAVSSTTLTVTTFAYASSAWSKTTSEYTLTAAE